MVYHKTFFYKKYIETDFIYRDVNEISNSSIRLLYASGPPQSLTVNGLIADNVDPSLGTYSWKIPSSVKAKK